MHCPTEVDEVVVVLENWLWTVYETVWQLPAAKLHRASLSASKCPLHIDLSSNILVDACCYRGVGGDKIIKSSCIVFPGVATPGLL